MVRIYRIPIAHKSDARRAMRAILASALQISEQELRVRFGPWGKPEHVGVHFSLSHSHQMALVALSPTQPVGIDLEWIRSVPNYPKIANRFFADGEKDCFDELSFLQIWTAKEALCKVSGNRIMDCLHQPVDWERVAAIDAGPGYVAHLAFQNPIRPLELEYVSDFAFNGSESPAGGGQ